MQEPLVIAGLFPHLLLGKLLLLVHLWDRRDDGLGEEPDQVFSEGDEVGVVPLDLPLEGVGDYLKDEGGVVDVAGHRASDDLVASKVKIMIYLYDYIRDYSGTRQTMFLCLFKTVPSSFLVSRRVLRLLEDFMEETLWLVFMFLSKKSYT